VKFWYRNAIDSISSWRQVAWRHSLLLTFVLISGGAGAAEVPSSAADEAASVPQVGMADPVPEVEAGPTVGDAALLETRLQGLSSFSASFVQEIQGARGQLLERSTGRVSLLRPAFRWQTRTSSS
jgi:hypothetical protein